MTVETTGIDLVAAVERTLATEVAPHITGEARFKVLMGASALRMVMRELSSASRLEDAAAALGDVAALVAGLRDGRHDADTAVYRALMEDAAARTAVSRPEAVA